MEMDASTRVLVALPFYLVGRGGDRKARGALSSWSLFARTLLGTLRFPACCVASTLFTMSAPSSTPSNVPSDDDNWQGFTSSLITSLPTLQSSSGSMVSSPPSQPSSSGSSGKFNSFTFVGASLTGGGGSKRTLLIMPQARIDRLCLGLVGTNKF